MKETIGTYQILEKIGQGGMGDIFLVFDPRCGRKVALKKMRPEWEKQIILKNRFIREAKLAAQLSHPSIIAIYAIHQDESGIYYTMPYIEGETLKSILRIARLQQNKGEALHPIGSSIAALVRIFLSLCQAIAYSHSKGILHRDLKPENVMVGRFGEVILLDWGLADFIDAEERLESNAEPESQDLTSPGKIPGTLSYLAPERALGHPSSIQTDLYALGVILYQLLTFKFPFQRVNLKELRRNYKVESFIPPEEAAPEREIAPQLSELVRTCLDIDPKKRYRSVNDLILHLENYIQGLPEWTFLTTLKIQNKSDWEFQENILLAKHIALTRHTEIMEWVSLMISKLAVTGNFKLECKLCLGKTSHGIGLLWSVPTPHEAQSLEEGYCLYIGSSYSQGARLYRNNVEVAHYPEIFLECDQFCTLKLEKIENHLAFYLNHQKMFGYTTQIPSHGQRLGILYRDADFAMEGLNLYIGSQNIMVNCLAVPDAFLHEKQFDRALNEYRKIAASFPGRAEGREAQFRAGLALLEKANSYAVAQDKEKFFEMALKEFDKLHGTAGAPFEYLGKALVYQASGELEEEVKCLELAIRKFAKHPLKAILVEQTIARMHDAARTHRPAAYAFALLCLQHLPSIFANHDHLALIESLRKHLEVPLFLPACNAHSELALQLAFWIDKPIKLVEIAQKEPTQRETALLALLALHHFEEAKTLLTAEEQPLFQGDLATLKPEAKWVPLLFYAAIDSGKIAPFLKWLERHFPTQFDVYKLWLYLWARQLGKAKRLLSRYDAKTLADDRTLLFPLYGCYLLATKNKKAALAHLAAVSDSAYPATPQLLSYFLLGRMDLNKNAFLWEKLELYRQLTLFYRCLKK